MTCVRQVPQPPEADVKITCLAEQNRERKLSVGSYQVIIWASACRIRQILSWFFVSWTWKAFWIKKPFVQNLVHHCSSTWLAASSETVGSQKTDGSFEFSRCSNWKPNLKMSQPTGPQIVLLSCCCILRECWGKVNTNTVGRGHFAYFLMYWSIWTKRTFLHYST